MSLTRLYPISLLSAALLVAACNRHPAEEAKVSLQPSETAAEAAPAPAAPATPPQMIGKPAAGPHLFWKLPEGWTEEGPGQMSVAHFTAKKASGTAVISITPMRGMGGKEDSLVNMWRGQAGQPPLEAGEAAKAMTEVDAAGAKGKLYQVSGASDGHDVALVTVTVQEGDTSWFYKLSGDASTVVEEKPAFLEFIRTVRIEPEGAADKHP